MYNFYKLFAVSNVSSTDTDTRRFKHSADTTQVFSKSIDTRYFRFTDRM